ncbi:hypothetical protein P175DRAFT_0478248 [Aspergillus ochraceoroseus IBT 24754]|uniref:Uncharacterized protein n=1 Tax=Aspergillus ochraceoroseus IBT 24754 TaxID=1392256 RepID=A0A2T5M107_9EURO|nr:uncharacterized protein P175DRAFT_0478248 [Aspergillus ochraceoroseus IBT 24754]PTU22224.1 hypothetical protein P175DRAFT_0478248 [Aspergillus ochraceoroseus IBT 24754]
MSPIDQTSQGRLPKRSRPNDVGSDSVVQNKREGVKRRRTSGVENGVEEDSRSSKASKESGNTNNRDMIVASNETSLHKTEEKPASLSESWSLLRGIAGQFSNLDPTFSFDEQYLLLGLEEAVHVYSIATSRLFRALEIAPGDSIIGYRLSPVNQERLYIFTLSGSVSEWDWPSGKQVAHWHTYHKTISADLVYGDAASDTTGSYATLFSLRERKDGKKELVITPLNSENPQSTAILETNTKIVSFRVAADGQAVFAYGGSHAFFGCVTSNQGSGSLQYTWREVKLPFSITCVDIKQDGTPKQSKAPGTLNRKALEFDLAVGGADGSILIYHNALGFLGIGSGREGDKSLAPRRLHWHRDPVRSVRWSKDGNYVISGGNESVMVLWQLDTGRKQFLPHLSSPISSIVVSGSGNAYAVKLSDNRIVVLSARELQPLATITGLQLCPRVAKFTDQPVSKASPSAAAVTAILHPQHPDQLLVTVPASHQITQDGSTLTNSPVLQTYDIRSNTHISRQALARTNVTTLNISPDGAQILPPDVKYLEVSQDGKWMATIDSWGPYPQDVEALGLEITGNTGARLDFEEIHLKFWRWSDSSGLWQLITRIDGPHSSDEGSASVLDLVSRPNSHEYATIGSDALLRFWRPVVRSRGGLQLDNVDQLPETWKCRNTLNLKGYIGGCSSNALKSASICFSQDGSVLAVCVQSTSTNPGLVVLIDVQSCSVRYSRIGVYSGEICDSSFVGCQLVIATKQSVFIWDTVNDVVRIIDLQGANSSLGGHDTRLLCVNPKTQTFAITARQLRGKASSKKARKSRVTVQVYDVHTLSLLSQSILTKEPVALLSNIHSAEYVILDAAANVQRLGCMGKAAQVSNPDDSALVKYPDAGLGSLFGRPSIGNANTPSTLAITGFNSRSSESVGLAGVFGDTPPFALPPSRVVFRDLVKALSV